MNQRKRGRTTSTPPVIEPSPTSERLPPGSHLLVLLLCLMASVPFWWIWRYGYTCDHVISGLMAKSILTRGERPLFLWMLGYNGILLESYVVAALFWLFGVGPRVYYAFSTLCFWGLAYVLYRHAKKRFGDGTGLLSALLLVVSSPYVYFYVMRPQPNYTEIFLLGMALFASVTALTRSLWLEGGGDAPRVRWQAAAAGFTLGFGLYTYQLILFFVGSLGLWLLCPYLEDLPRRGQRLAHSRRRLWRALVRLAALGACSLAASAVAFVGFAQAADDPGLCRGLFAFGVASVAMGTVGEFLLARADTLARSWRAILAFVGAGVIGYAPSLIFTYVQHGFSRDRLRVAPDPLQAWSNLQLYLEAQRRFLNAWEGPGAAAVGVGISLAALAWLVGSLRQLVAVARGRRPASDLFLVSPLAMMPLTAIPLFCLAQAAEDWKSARWTLALSLFFALAQARAIAAGWSSGGRRRALSAVLCGLLLMHNANALWSALSSPQAREFVGEELVAPLRARHITRAYGTYWFCYSIAFFTDEEIIIEPVFNNYSPHYAKEVQGASRIAFVDALGPQLQRFPASVQIHGDTYQKVDSWFGKESGFVVLEKQTEADR